MSVEFVHLHLHTDYSLLDGACPISWMSKLHDKEKAKGKDDIIQLARENNMKAVAITDHGVMGGCLEFHNELKSNGLKPVIGCETYLAPGSRFDKRPDIPHVKGYHLILLAQNDQGYHNLCQLISEAHTNGFYYKPRIDKELLAQYHEGIIGMSACLQGELDVAMLHGGVAEAEKVLADYVDIFGKDNFFLEIMYHGIKEQATVNRGFIELSRKTGIPLVATNDVHYLRKEHAKAQEIMLCIGTRTTMDDPNRMRMSSDEFYFKSGEEMFEIFGTEAPEAISNTVAIAERCDVTIGYENHYPSFTPPDGTTPKEYLKKLCIEGYPRRYGYDLLNPPPEMADDAKLKKDRLEYELGIIDKTKYNSYFLVVWDFINAAKKMGVPVGPGRGSGAGSLVAFLVGITDIDPIRYSLLFERFLNPERVSPPDFDIDFCERRRSEVIEYVIGKYGNDCVSQIGTYGALKAKMVVKDVARVMGRKPADGNMLTKMIPDDPKITLKGAIEKAPALKATIECEDWVKELFEYSSTIELLNRQMGIHAAGVIICNQPLANLVPLGRGAHEEVITQFVAPLCESIGLLKMDFLGLRTLTVIQDAVDNVRKNRGIKIDLDKIPLDDKLTFDLVNRGDTVAVFQLESSGMQSLCRSFRVETIKHLIALIAIYRPGPMQFIDTFVGRKNKTIPLEYDHPLLEQYLSETYGLMLYQEQIMQVVQVLAGFRLGEADILRRAIGKKKLDVMTAQHEKFIKGCADTNQIPEKLAEKIWNDILGFANYGFNKSHSAAYALMTYRTAYFKAHYCPEFFAAVLTSELTNSKKLSFLINECRNSGIKISPPDINYSDVNFTVNGDEIRFGLGAIKGFGQGISNSIIEARENGPFTGITDLLERTAGLNTKGLEALIRCGALDSLKLKRSQMLEMVETCIKRAASKKKDQETGQIDLFAFFGDEEMVSSDPPPPDIPELSSDEMLNDEKTMLGFYVSGHPLDAQKRVIDLFSTATLAEISEMPSDVGVKFGAMISSVSKKMTKADNKPFAILQIEDLTGNIECACFPKVYAACEPFLTEGTKVFVRAMTKREEQNVNDDNGEMQESTVSLIVESICPLEQAFVSNTESICVFIDENECADINRTLEDVAEIIKKHRWTVPEDALEYHGNNQDMNPPVPLVLNIKIKDGRQVFLETDSSMNVRMSDELLTELDVLLGENHYLLKANANVPHAKRFRKKNKTEKKNQETT